MALRHHDLRHTLRLWNGLPPLRIHRPDSCTEPGECPLDDFRHWQKNRCPRHFGCPVATRDAIATERQKLVDTAIVADTIHLARYDRSNWVAVVSNDDDILPGLLSGAAEHERLILVTVARTQPSAYAALPNGRRLRRLEDEPMTTLNERILAELRTDLVSFADTHSPVVLESDGAIWTRQGRTQEATFRQAAAAYPDVQLNGATQPYATFLASDEMANLTALAESISLAFGQGPENYVEPKAKSDETGPEEGLAGEVVPKLLQHPSFGSTRVVFLRGAAGAGKTVTLRKLVHRQAQDYLNHETTFLYLYVDAQARYLARLDDAVALVLQDLNAHFTYRALATLTRHRLVVPIVDGFDELLGAGGGGEAVQALTRFLTRLDGRGAMVVSSRSTYFDFGRIRTQADHYRSADANFEIVPADLLPWTEDEMCSYLDSNRLCEKLGAGTPQEALEALKRTYFAGADEASLLSTPFFLTAAVDVARQNAAEDEVAAGTSAQRPIGRIIASFVRREVGKFRNTSDEPILSEEDHQGFLRMLAEEMWWQERRELDRESVETIAELFAEQVGLSDSDLRAFSARASSYAFLSAQKGHGPGPALLAFSHEYYYAFFVARFLAQRLAAGEDVAGLLGRTEVSPTVAEEFGEQVLENRDAWLPGILTALANRPVPTTERETNRGNAGALYAAALSKCPRIENLHVVDASFVGVDLRGSAQKNASLGRCDFIDVDFRSADWSFDESATCSFVRLRVDPLTTRLNGLRLAGTDLYGIASGEGRIEYDPKRVRRICEKIGIELRQEEAASTDSESVSYSSHAEQMIQLLHKLLRIADRTYYLSDDVLNRRGVSTRAHWADLKGLLQDYDLLEEKVVQKSGTQLLRLAFPPNVIAEGEGMATDSAVGGFWREIKRL